MEGLNAAFDSYTLYAQLRPALLAVLPVGLALATCFPQDLTVMGALCGIGVTCGLSALSAQFARDIGKRKEPLLYARWGAVPTTRLLRHSDSGLNALTRQRYHAILAKILPDLSLPDKDAEANDSDAADAIYASCVDRLREETRDHDKFGLVFASNINYGFRRNLWGMKPYGIAIACAGLAVSLSCMIIRRKAGIGVVGTVSVLSDVVLLGLWLWTITPDWVKAAADAYAKQLLAACEKLTPASSEVK